MTEHGEQAAVIQWARLHGLPWLHAIPNGARLPRRYTKSGWSWSPEAMKLKEEGLTSGVSDLFLPKAVAGWHGMYIELKVKGNKPTPNQVAFLDAMHEEGYRALACWGAMEAIEAIKEYLRGDVKRELQ